MTRALPIALALLAAACGGQQGRPTASTDPGFVPGQHVAPEGLPATKEALFETVVAAVVAKDKTRLEHLAPTVEGIKQYCPEEARNEEFIADVEDDMRKMPEAISAAVDECWVYTDLTGGTLVAPRQEQPESAEGGCKNAPVGHAHLEVRAGAATVWIELQWAHTADGFYLADEPRCERELPPPEADDDTGA